MRILFIGSSTSLSLTPLKQILQSGHTVCAVAMEATQTNPFYNPLFNALIHSSKTDNIHLDSFARQNSLPVLIFSEKILDNVSLIQNYSPDIILVSCFGKRLPDEILSIPTLGCFNLHPSLLPKFRGPTPVFWQFKYAADLFGITLHRMTYNFDDGDIINQSEIKLDDGISYLQAISELANLSASLINHTLNNFSKFLQTSVVQNDQLSSYYSYPVPDDYKINTQCSAKSQYNFIKAYQGNNTVFPFEVNNQLFLITEAMSYELNTSNKPEFINDQIIIPCSSGNLTAKIQPL